MRSMQLVGLVLVVAMGVGFHSSKAEAVTAWSAIAAGCVPVETFGVNVAAGAVIAGSGTTVTLYCSIPGNALTGGFNHIEITYKGRGAPDVSTTAELIQMSKATGLEDVMCGIQGKGSDIITTENNVCGHSGLDFDNNFVYVRIVLKSGNFIQQLQTIYGTSLTTGSL